jgi:hypothetical protein
MIPEGNPVRRVVAERLEPNELFQMMLLLMLLPLKNIKNPKIHTKGGVFMLSILQGVHKAFTRLHTRRLCMAFAVLYSRFLQGFFPRLL